MAGDHHRQRVCPARLRHRAHRLRQPNPPGNVGVVRGRAGRDLAQSLPDQLLKSRAAQVERQIEFAPGESMWRATCATVSPSSASSAMRFAFGKRACTWRTSSSESSPRKMAQIPLAEAATTTRPREQAAVEKRSVSRAARPGGAVGVVSMVAVEWSIEGSAAGVGPRVPCGDCGYRERAMAMGSTLVPPSRSLFPLVPKVSEALWERRDGCSKLRFPAPHSHPMRSCNYTPYQR